MKRVLNLSDFYVGVCVLCMLNGVLFAGGSFVIVGLQALLIIMSIVYAFYDNLNYGLPSYFHGLNLLLILFSVYGFFLLTGGDELIIQYTGERVSKTTYLKNVYLSLLPVYPFYHFSRRGLLTLERIRFWAIIFFIVAIVVFLNNRAQIMDLRSVEEITNNASYTFVGLLPALVLFDRQRFFQYLFLGGCLVFIVIGMKRGAIVSGAIGLIWFLYFSTKESDRKRKKLYFILSIVAVIVAYYVVSYMIANSDYFNSRIAQTVSGSSSGRDSLYAIFYDHYIHETDFWKFMFGNGASATLNIGDNYAHNDWLEIAINQGLLGLMIYAFYWICFFKTWKGAKGNPQSHIAIGMVMIIYLVTTLFSMSYDGMSRCSTMVLGYFLACQR